MVSMLMFLVAVISYGQRTEPLKGDNFMTIKTQLTADENFVNFGKYLVSKGYALETKDKEFLTMRTGAIQTKYLSKFRFNIYFVDSEIRIKPELMVAAGSWATEYIWINWKYKGASRDKWAFEKFQPILAEYGKIYYSKV